MYTYIHTHIRVKAINMYIYTVEPPALRPPALQNPWHCTPPNLLNCAFYGLSAGPYFVNPGPYLSDAQGGALLFVLENFSKLNNVVEI